MNVVAFIGNLTRDAELKYLPSGTAVCQFSIAINEKFKKGEEWDEKTYYFDLESFGNLAERCGKLVRGDMVSVVGQAKQESWEKDGQKRSKVSFRVNQLKVVKYKNPSNADERPAAASTASVSNSNTGFNDDIPF